MQNKAMAPSTVKEASSSETLSGTFAHRLIGTLTTSRTPAGCAQNVAVAFMSGTAGGVSGFDPLTALGSFDADADDDADYAETEQY